MTTRLEEAFAAALEIDTPDIGELPPAFFSTITSRVRRRRRRRAIAVVAACAMAVAIGSTAVAIPLQASHPASTDRSALPPRALSDQAPDWEKLPNLDTVWPNATRRLPGRLPNNNQYVVRAVLPGHRYIVLEMTEQTPGFRLSRPGIFAPDAGTLIPLSDPSTPSDFVIGVGVIGDYAVWVNQVEPPGGKTINEIWSAPLSGGPARKLKTLQGQYRRQDGVMVGSGPGSFAIAGNYVMWDRSEAYLHNGELARRNVGIYRLPPTGGQPELVPGSQGFQLSPFYSGFGGTTAVATQGSKTNGVLLDLITGRKLPWTLSAEAPGNVAGTSFVACGLVGCTGVWGPLGPGGGDHAVVQQTDGGGFLTIGTGSVNPAGDGRFVLYSYSTSTEPRGGKARTGQTRLAIWDRVTGRAALCQSRDQANPATQPILLPRPDEYGLPFVSWEDRGSLVLLDLRELS